MIINHNISALNTYNKLQKNNKSTENVMEKLSSGLRINSASDDSAGLAISEKMRAQIRGLQQAERNIQDGISLIQTAESGLATIQDPNLLRLRELAIQSANDTLTNADRQKIQEEVLQIEEGINEIANNTHFNDIKLLNNVKKTVVTTSEVEKSITYNWTSNISLKNVTKTSDGGYIGNISGYAYKLDEEGNQEWSESAGVPGGKIENIKETSDGGYILLTTNGFADSLSGQKITATKLDSSRNEVWKTGVTGVYAIEGREIIETNDGNYVIAGAGSGIQNWDGLISKINKDGVQQVARVFGSTESDPDGYGHDEFIAIKETTDGGYIAIGQSSVKIGGVYSDETNFVVKFDNNLNPVWDKRVGGSKGGSANDLTATDDGGAIIVGRYNDSVTSGGYVYKIDINGNLEWEKVNSDRGTEDIEKTSDGNFLVGGNMDGNPYLNVIDESGNPIAEFKIDNGTLTGTITDIIKNSDGSYTLVSSNNMVNVNLTYGFDSTIQIHNKEISLQIGANSGESFSIELTDARTTALGIDDINLSTRQGAETALTKIDEAMETISSERSKFGAYQNSLEHILNNVSNYAINLSSSESRIRDANMAKQMMDLTKNQILSQASQAMLTQGIQQPQQVLQLMK